MKVRTYADYIAAGETPEILFWVGCAGSFDQRAQRVTKAFAKILDYAGVKFAVLGNEESCTGDPAKRAGNEFLFQMQANNNIAVLNGYGVEKIVATCPHCFNTIKNEYPELGGNYEVLHHMQFLQSLINEGRLKIKGGFYKGKKITYHDSCYLGRGNDVYEAPREVIAAMEADLVEMKTCRSKGMCCGAGGAQVFKESEKGKKEINTARIEQAIETEAKIVASNCPFCMIMLQDGVKACGQENNMQVIDIAELIAKAEDLID
ncbi:MAG: (Fe-S)-binding protein [Bacteroidia bacterium]|jgi:Fe-S oxidoreductase|nr:(Fe-S)-binding protein [Bacteroidia bacterium]MCO5252850.1 (Fe-S)-binding protein [Bacteroidota bacterium]